MEDHRLEARDYTVLFILMNQNEEVVSGTYADLYLSDREIPLEGIDLTSMNWRPRAARSESPQAWAPSSPLACGTGPTTPRRTGATP